MDVYYYEMMETLRMMAPMLIFLGVLWIGLIVGGILNYVFRGVGILKMSQNRGISGGALGFVPIAHRYQLGKLAGNIEFGNKKINNPGLWEVLLPIILGAVATLSYIAIFVWFFVRIFALEATGAINDPAAMYGMMNTFFVWLILWIAIVTVANVILMLFKGLILHRIFALYVGGQKPVFYLILALFVPLAESILLFKLRNKPVVNSDI